MSDGDDYHGDAHNDMQDFIPDEINQNRQQVSVGVSHLFVLLKQQQQTSEDVKSVRVDSKSEEM